MSCSNCDCSPCTCADECDPSNEPLASALENFVTEFFGTITKTCVNDEIVWTLPCDLGDTPIPGFPRIANEGLACYFARVFPQLTTLPGAQGPAGPAGATGADGPQGTPGLGNDIAVLDEGVEQTPSATSIDFVGAGVIATAVGGVVTVTISGGGAAELSPATIGGRIVHYDASALLGLVDNDPVSTFTDQSGNGFDAVAAGGVRPLYKTNQLNSLPSVRFDGTDDTMGIAAAGASVVVADGFTIIAVLRGTTGLMNANRGVMFFKTSLTQSLIWQFDTAAANGMYVGIRGGNVINFDVKELLTDDAAIYGILKQGVYDASPTNGWSSIINGFGREFQDAIGVIGGADNVSILGSGNGGEFFAGDIFELIVFGKRLTGYELRGLHQYFANKYAI